MNVDLSREEIAILLESLKYSRQRIADAQATPHDVRQENLRRLERVEQTLRNAS
jgi:hypothetical protein